MHVVVERREEDGEINQQIWLHKRQEEMKEERCNDVKEKNKNKKQILLPKVLILPSSDLKKQRHTLPQKTKTCTCIGQG